MADETQNTQETQTTPVVTVQGATVEQLAAMTKQDLINLQAHMQALASTGLADVEQTLANIEQALAAKVQEEEANVVSWFQQFREKQGISFSVVGAHIGCQVVIIGLLIWLVLR